QELSRDIAVDADAGGGIVLEPDVTLECDERPGVLRAQPLCGPDRLRNRLAVLGRAECRQRATDMTQAAELIDRSPELGLEDDDDRDAEQKGAVAEQPRKQHEVEGGRERADEREHDEADQDLRALCAANEAQDVIEDDRDYGDVDDLQPREVPHHLLELDDELRDDLGHAGSAPTISAMSAI